MSMLLRRHYVTEEVIDECLENCIEKDDSIGDIDYNSMKFNELKKLCSEKNIKVENTFKKEDLINLLQEVK